MSPPLPCPFHSYRRLSNPNTSCPTVLSSRSRAYTLHRPQRHDRTAATVFVQVLLIDTVPIIRSHIIMIVSRVHEGAVDSSVDRTISFTYIIYIIVSRQYVYYFASEVGVLYHGLVLPAVVDG